MCGRFTQLATWAEVWAFSQPLTLTVPDVEATPRYNLAPTQQAWVIATDGKGGGKAGTMRWGLVPHWSKAIDGSLATFNARIESAADKPTFRQPFQRRHCLVPASGYYEWVGEGREKQPWYIHPVDAPLMFFAGLWDRWVSPLGEPLLSFTVLTQPAEGAMHALHPRRPVVVPPERAQTWLEAAVHPAGEVMRELTERRPALQWHRVGKAVGNARMDDPTLIQRVG